MGIHTTFDKTLSGISILSNSNSDKKGSTEKVEKRKGLKDKRHKKNKKRKENSEAAGILNSDVVVFNIQRLLKEIPQSKKLLHQIFWQLDNKQGVSLSSCKEEFKDLLLILFKSLNLLEHKGAFVRHPKDYPIIRRFGWVLDEELPDNLNLEEKIDSVEDSKNKEFGSATISSCSLEDTKLFAMEKGDLEHAKRLIGPKAPSAELLKMAVMAQDEDAFIGPTSDILAEDEETAGGKCTEEISRILRILSDAKSNDIDPDAYEILDLDSNVCKTDIQRKFWKLSLLVHPDKCNHKKADVAFKAVKDAANCLKDLDRRLSLDNNRLIAQEATLLNQELKKQERVHQWQVVKGHESLNVSSSATCVREEWLTNLPTSKNPIAVQKNQTVFSQQEILQVSETWAQTPQQQLEALKASANKYLTTDDDVLRNQVTVDFKSESLMDKHNRLRRVENKAAKKNKSGQSGRDVTSVMREPFDHNRDLSWPSSKKSATLNLGKLNKSFESAKNHHY